MFVSLNRIRNLVGPIPDPYYVPSPLWQVSQRRAKLFYYHLHSAADFPVSDHLYYIFIALSLCLFRSHSVSKHSQFQSEPHYAGNNQTTTVENWNKNTNLCWTVPVDSRGAKNSVPSARFLQDRESEKVWYQCKQYWMILRYPATIVRSVGFLNFMFKRVDVFYTTRMANPVFGLSVWVKLKVF